MISAPLTALVRSLEYTASMGKPVIISTGVATEADIDRALTACREVGNDRVSLLKCTSQYPATIEQANLLTIPDMERRFGVEVGVSDHTLGSLVPVVAVSLGARIVEKHFVLNRELGGPDAPFSMEPHEFKEMVRAVRQAEAALGKVTYEVSEKDKGRRRSLFVVQDIEKGEVFTSENIQSIRPGDGLPPRLLNEVLGKRASVALERGTPLLEGHLAS